MPAFSSPFPLVAARRAHLPFTARAPTSIETARAFVRFVAAVVVVVAAIVVLFFSFSPPFFFYPHPFVFPSETRSGNESFTVRTLALSRPTKIHL